MNEYRFIEDANGMGVMQKKVRQQGQPDTWVDDLKTPVYRNEYAKKKWVEDMIHIADPEFKGTYTDMADIEAISPVNANDWAYLKEQDESGNDFYSRYRYTEASGWIFEVAIKCDNFTDEEWAAITSGINSTLVEKLEDIDVEATAKEVVADTIDTMIMNEDTGDVTIQYDDGEEDPEENDNNEE